jgi:transcriptional regulator with XRE-family HTH domain
MTGTAVGEQPEQTGAESGVLRCFGRQVKLFRERAGLTQAELGRRIGYSGDLVASVERGRRVAQPEFIDAADEVLDAGGVLAAAKESVAHARFPEWFRAFARMEAEAVELHACDTMVVNGLLQTVEQVVRVALPVPVRYPPPRGGPPGRSRPPCGSPRP